MRIFLTLLLFVQILWASTTFEKELASLKAYGTPFIDSLFREELESQTPISPLPEAAYQKILTALFMHKLLTTTDAVDGASGGILSLPYYWHWCTPNPRHSLIYIPTGKQLLQEKPPEGYAKYKSYADIDRTPAIYLANLFADEPLFRDSDIGDFYSFGWCSEREMAYAALLSIMGFECKIIQEGIHVWSEVLIPYSQKEKKGYLILKVDNTFEQFSIHNLTRNKSEWKKDFGNGAQVAWYNKKFASIKERERIQNIAISTKRVASIKKAIDRWYIAMKRAQE